MNKLVYLLERTLNSKSKNLTKADEYMFYSPFVSHYKPKLQVNIESRSEEHTSELQSRLHLVCRLLLEKKKKTNKTSHTHTTHIIQYKKNTLSDHNTYA